MPRNRVHPNRLDAKASLLPAPTPPENPERGKPFETNPRLLAIEAVMFAAMAVIGAAITYHVVNRPTDDAESGAPSALTVPAMIEADALPVTERRGEFVSGAQDTSTFVNGQWTGNRHLFAAAKAPGDALSLKLPAREPGGYDLTVYLTKARDYGVMQIYVNGDKVGGPIDLWSERIEATGPLPVGRITLRGQDDLIRFEVVGKNDLASPPFYQFGVDGMVLSPAP